MKDLGGILNLYNMITPQDVATAAETSTRTNGYVSTTGHEYGIMVISAHLTATKTAIAQLTCASDAAGTGKADVSGFTVTLTGATGDSDEVGGISFNVNDLDLDNDKYFVGVDVTTNEDGDDIAASLALGGGDTQSDQNT